MAFTTMPFGKYKGLRISSVDSQYLEWCLKNIQFKNPTLKQDIEHELFRRASEEEDLKQYSYDPNDPDEIPF